MRHCPTSQKVAGSIPDLEFFIDIILPPALYGPRVDSASNRNEYQEYFLGGKGGWFVGLTLATSRAECLESASLNLLEPSGPVQTCNGIALLSGLVEIINKIVEYG